MNNDLISRSALLREYGDFKDMDCPSGHTVTADYMIELAEDAPAVDAEPVRHGRWDSFGVRRTDAKGRNRIEYMFNACTLCENPAVKRTVYCPNCGAKMDGDKDA